jgi:ubiquinol-cytochrome c reductase cytochrome c1 subunit
MIRIFSILAGLFFSLALLVSLGTGAYNAITEPAAETVEHAFHKHPKELHLASDGVFGHFDRQQVQRGFQVYENVCASCHSLKHVAYRDLTALGYTEAEVKAIAAKATIAGKDPLTGEVKDRPGMPADKFPPVVYAGLGVPPDLSLMAKARHDGGAYVYSLLTGYSNPPKTIRVEPKLAKQLADAGKVVLSGGANQPNYDVPVTAVFPDFQTPTGLHYNPYFANLNLAMAPPLSEGLVTYGEGNKDKNGKPIVATVDQMAQDVAAFLVWTAEPKLEKRLQAGWAVFLFLLFATVLGYLAYRNVWRNQPGH